MSKTVDTQIVESICKIAAKNLGTIAFQNQVNKILLLHGCISLDLKTGMVETNLRAKVYTTAYVFHDDVQCKYFAHGIIAGGNKSVSVVGIYQCKDGNNGGTVFRVLIHDEKVKKKIDIPEDWERIEVPA